MTPRIVNVHSVPPRGDISRFRAEERAPRAERFGDRVALVLVAAADRGAVPERWGLGVALVVIGRTVLGACLVVADGVADRDPAALAALANWAARQELATPNGPLPVEVVTRSEFCDPAGGLLLGRTYRGGGWLVTADAGRSLGLLGEEPPPGRSWPQARGQLFKGGFTIGLPGCGAYGFREDAKGRKRWGWQAMLHTPPLRIKPLGDHGVAAEYGRAGRGGYTPDGKPAGHWERGRPFLGRIVDLIGPAFALDGRDTASLAAHLEAFGVPALDVPAAVPVTPGGADDLLAIALGVHDLALALDAELARWLVRREDLRNGNATVGLRELVSGGSVATRIWRRSGATPPLAKFAVPDDGALGAFAAATHGGWCTADLRGQVLPAVDGDVRQAYAAAASLVGVHRVLFAGALREVDHTEAVRALSEQAAAGTWTSFLDRATYERHGLDRCLVVCRGEPWPVELPTTRGPRFYVRPYRTSDPTPMTFGDVMAASFLGRRPVEVLSATGLERVGTESVRPVPLRDGVVVPAGEDPIAALVRLRPDKGVDDLLRDAIRGVSNPLAWGVFSRLDQRWVKGQLTESYAAWSWPPIAACIPGAIRMWLAMIDRAVTDAGGAVVCRDTDGIAVVSLPEGAWVPLASGRRTRALSWAEVEAVFGRFDALDSFGDGGSFWTLNRGTKNRPLHILSLARKRYTKLQAKGPGFEIVDGTEHALGGGVIDPPGWGAIGPEGLRGWVCAVHEYALACAIGPDPGWHPPWDRGADEPFPVLRRLTAGSPEVLAELPEALGLHPFAPFIEAAPDKLFGDPGAPVSLDPGDDLADWSQIAWFDRLGRPLRLASRWGSDVDVVLRSLEDYAYHWAQPAPPDDDSLIEGDTRLVRRVGRGGALIDAQLADPDARVEDHQVVYAEGDPAGFVAERARALGPRAFARLTGLPLKVAERAALGRPISPANVQKALLALTEPSLGRQCALDGCERPVLRPNATYCSKAHRDRAYRWRTRLGRTAVGKDPYAGVPTCGACGALMLGAAVGPDGLCVDCAEGATS